ncbi:hypothetical protein DEFDS_P226 (plasmid) [Deferribacter desulfuricans SSM1]|uniref:Uncharacterized protein n=1 Tax=Deferribacter desulfuricans (strain DSM 14783 / JCM 11476 / NBRC 101012 / SSM1) TaxID=639282 RepID=D3PF54_DEFDS|nr:hypothetical protein [Deferribacter desulfuricans]BAI81846.1 hypothetical protein DEFDS_P226 [Deferribacter desulfuricans SSM1]
MMEFQLNNRLDDIFSNLDFVDMNIKVKNKNYTIPVNTHTTIESNFTTTILDFLLFNILKPEEIQSFLQNLDEIKFNLYFSKKDLPNEYTFKFDLAQYIHEFLLRNKTAKLFLNILSNNGPVNIGDLELSIHTAINIIKNETLMKKIQINTNIPMINSLKDELSQHFLFKILQQDIKDSDTLFKYLGQTDTNKLIENLGKFILYCVNNSKNINSLISKLYQYKEDYIQNYTILHNNIKTLKNKLNISFNNNNDLNLK